MAIKVYEKGKKVQLSKNFTSAEFDCHGKGCCSQTSIDDKLVKYVQQFRDHFGKAVTINSGYRCPTHNASVGGASKSNHMDGEAADIKIKGITPLELAQYAESIGIKGIGVYSWGVHIDTRTSKYFWYDGGESNVKTFGGQATITTKPSTTPTVKVTAQPKVIWNYFKSKGLSDCGIAGLMGNLYAESALLPNNLQNSYSKKLDLSDEEYTAQVDNGTYTNFVRDSAGYGLAQWTYWSRKQNLLNFAKSKNKSIGDLNMQLEFLYKELSESFSKVLSVLKTSKSVEEASNAVLMDFERPANAASQKTTRANYSKNYYSKYAEPTSDIIPPTTTTPTPTVTNSKNSPLVTYTKISPNRNSPRNHTIDTITIHCIVGQWTAKQGCDYFANSSVQASCNYVVGKDGSIGLCVEEKDRSWCSSNRANDNRAITIEVASDTTHPYAVTNAAYNALIELLVDICKRNNIKELKWEGDKSLIGQITKQNMTVHRWFKAGKECPGDYLYERHGEIAAAVNKKLGVASSQPVVSIPKVEESKFPYLVRINTALLNVRAGAGTNYKITTRVKKNEVYTIVDEIDGWGKLKSGAGWISLKYTVKK